VRLLKTGIAALFWRALTLRDHAWHGRDLSRKLAVVRQGASAGTSRDWGSATRGLLATGPCVSRNPASSVAELLEWLINERPAYLLTYPSLLRELARTCLARGIRVPGLLEVRAFGELLDPEVRELCREAFGAPLTDMYSAQEVGYIALQCPGREHYHVQSESLIVEVLDDSGNACRPGEIGRVVVTDLHNFAMPLLRYELGDFAEVGEPCACGRGLPVLKRIVGRVRNTLVTARGERYWPSFGVRRFADIAPVLQHQFVQKGFDLIEARLVVAAPLSADQEQRLAERIVQRLPGGFRVEFAYCERIARGAGGKYEDFVSEVSA
jgi:phenylacetate-CoA ligase